jgi:hypothetical protein
MKVPRKGEKLFWKILNILLLVVFLASFSYGLYMIAK